jgi:hypothetical protein
MLRETTHKKPRCGACNNNSTTKYVPLVAGFEKLVRLVRKLARFMEIIALEHVVVGALLRNVELSIKCGHIRRSRVVEVLEKCKGEK